MAVYVVQISELAQVEIDVAPGAPALCAVELEFAVGSDEVAGVLSELGGAHRFHSATSGGLHVRYAVPLTRDGEFAGRARLKVYEKSPVQLARLLTPMSEVP